MKKVILALSVIGFMTACSSSSTTEEVKTDSTTVVVDTVAVTPVDSTACCVGATGTVETSSTTPTTK